jgi:hypothetical protein
MISEVYHSYRIVLTFRDSRSLAVSIGPWKKQGISLQEADHGHQMQHGQHLVPWICHRCLLQFIYKISLEHSEKLARLFINVKPVLT